MIPKVKPAFAWPDFSTSTATFAPDRWPEVEQSPSTLQRFAATGRTAAGALVNQMSGVSERRVVLKYPAITTAEKESLLGGAGFFETVGGSAFEFKNFDGVVMEVKFAMSRFTAVEEADGRWRISPIELLVV